MATTDYLSGDIRQRLTILRRLARLMDDLDSDTLRQALGRRTMPWAVR